MSVMSSSKAVAPYDASYEFALGEELRQMAAVEVRETEHLRQQSLVAMRAWIEKNPKIVKCRYDASFLLRFLRAKKFSLPTTQETLERYLLLREVYDHSVFHSVRLSEPNVADLLQRGMGFVLPERDRLGRRVLVIQPRAFDMNKHTLRDLMRLFTITAETLIEDEENQIRGFVYLVDAAGASLQMLTLISPKEALKLVKNGEALVPMRHALGIGCNVASTMKIAVDFLLNLLSEKLRSRVKLVNDFKNCPEIDVRTLPREMGGSRPMAEMIEAWTKEMNCAATKAMYEQNDEMAVNLSLFTKQEMEGNLSADSRTTTDDCGWNSIPGSFRKLEVD